MPVDRQKAHWGHKKLLILARTEILFQRLGVTNINQRLVEITPGQTLEAIKGVCKNEHRPTPAKGLQMTFPMIPLQPLQIRLLSGRDRSGTPYTTSACQMASTLMPSALVNLQHKPGPCSTRNMTGGYHHWQDPTGGHLDGDLGPPGYGLDNQGGQRG